MKYTLLQLTQTILSRMDSDEINSIQDNQESLQVATNIRTTYFNLITRGQLPEHYDLFELIPTTDNDKPVVMYLPENITKLIWVKYDSFELNSDEPNLQNVEYSPLNQFLDRMYNRDATDPTVATFEFTRSNGDPITFLYKIDSRPRYYTTFDDGTIVFDSLDTQVDTTLQKSKTTCYGTRTVDFPLSDNFIPLLDETQFPLLLEEATSLCFAEMKQMQNPIAERNARRGWVTLQKSKYRIKPESDFDKLPNFGRK